MKLGLGLYRHMLNDEYYSFAVQAGCTHVIIHLVDYFRQGEANPNQNQPTGGIDKPWGVAGDPDKLWTAAEMTQLRKQLTILLFNAQPPQPPAAPNQPRADR